MGAVRMGRQALERVAGYVQSALVTGIAGAMVWVASSIVAHGRTMAVHDVRLQNAETTLRNLPPAAAEPPEWFVKRMDRLESKVDGLDERLREVERGR